MNPLDLIGYKTGRLCVTKYIGCYIKDGCKSKQHWYECVCNCNNNIVVISRRNLISGHTRSCGCIDKERKMNSRLLNKYDLESYDFGVGYTTKGESFYFDKEDFDLIKNYTWYIDNYGHVVTKPSSGTLRISRLIANAIDEFEVDHISHNKLDNRKCNLRVIEHKYNGKNLPLSKRNTSGITGVWFRKDINKWVAEIRIDYKKISLGCFDKKEDAIKARKEAEEKYFGEYSYDNSMKIAKENGFIEDK